MTEVYRKGLVPLILENFVEDTVIGTSGELAALESNVYSPESKMELLGKLLDQ